MKHKQTYTSPHVYGFITLNRHSMDIETTKPKYCWYEVETSEKQDCTHKNKRESGINTVIVYMPKKDTSRFFCLFTLACSTLFLLLVTFGGYNVLTESRTHWFLLPQAILNSLLKSEFCACPLDLLCTWLAVLNINMKHSENSSHMWVQTFLMEFNNAHTHPIGKLNTIVPNSTPENDSSSEQ